jgi:predicted alpha/beta superfamily hydrolase
MSSANGIDTNLNRRYLPPSYHNSQKRYPVVYLLHGFMLSYQTWIDDNRFVNVLQND